MGRCNWGIATQRPDLVKRLNPDLGAARLVNLVTAWQHEIKEMMGGMGINSIEALKGNRLMLRGVGMTEKELEDPGDFSRRRIVDFPLLYGIITPKLPLTRLRVCAAHAPVLTHRALGTLNHAKPQQVRFC